MASLVTSIPIVIFMIIRDFLREKDYRRFMNCDKRYFQGIKWETIQWHLKIRMDLDKDYIRGKFIKFETLVSHVKDKHAQIGLTLESVSYSKLFVYAPYFANIWKLKVALHEIYRETNGDNVNAVVEEKKSYESLDFSILNNIDQVELEGFGFVKEVTAGFRNVRVLKLYKWPDLKSMKCPLKGFQLLSIDCCPNLRTITPPEDAEELLFKDVSLDHLDLRRSAHTVTSIHYSSRKTACLQWFVSFRFPKLKKLLAHYRRHGGEEEEQAGLFDEAMFPALISLDLAVDGEYMLLPVSSLTLLESLTLDGFDLSSWSQQLSSGICHQNFMILSLTGCWIHFPSFPTECFPNLQKLHLAQLSSLETLPALPECRELRLEECPSLLSLDVYPKLRKLHLANFDFTSRSDLLTSFDGQFLSGVTLDRCRHVDRVAIFRNTQSLYVTDCEDIQSFSGFHLSQRPMKDRVVTIDECDATDFDWRGLSNLHRLRFDGVSDIHLKDHGQSNLCLSDIDDLDFTFCQDFIIDSSFQFQQIHHSISFHSSSIFLLREDGNRVCPFQSIPVVILNDVTINDLRPFAGCPEVYFRDVDLIEKALAEMGLTEYDDYYHDYHDYDDDYEDKISELLDVIQSIGKLYTYEDDQVAPQLLMENGLLCN